MLLIDSKPLEKSFNGVLSFALFQSKTPKSPTYPTVNLLKYGLRVSTLEIVKPSSSDLIKLLDNLVQTNASISLCDPSNFVLESMQRLWGDSNVPVIEQSEAKEFSMVDFIYSTFGRINLEFKTLFDKFCNRGQYPFASCF